MASYNYYHWQPSGLGAHVLHPQNVVGHVGGQTAAWNPPFSSQSPLTTTSASQASSTPVHAIFLKVFNPANKKEWQDYTIRNISRDLLDTPAKLKEVIVSQCGENIVPEEVGYFNQATKHWIHNRLDRNDVWDMIESGAM